MTKTTEDLSGLGMAGKLTVDELNKRRARQATRPFNAALLQSVYTTGEKEALEELNRFNEHIAGLNRHFLAEEFPRLCVLCLGVGFLSGGIIGFLFGYFI